MVAPPIQVILRLEALLLLVDLQQVRRLLEARHRQGAIRLQEAFLHQLNHQVAEQKMNF